MTGTKLPPDGPVTDIDRHARPTLLILLALVILTLGVYWRLPAHDFINFDDPGYVYNNAFVQEGFTRRAIDWAFSFGNYNYWHPVTWLSHMVDCRLFGLRPGPHHLMNLGLHLLTAFVLFVALRRMTGAAWRSGLVALLFAVHPLNVDSVAWISERKNVLSALFWMLCLLVYARYAVAPRRWWRYLALAVAMALGMMAKPMLVTLPFALLLLDFWPLGRLGLPGHRGSIPTGRLLIEKVPLLLISAAGALIPMVTARQLGLFISTEQVSIPLRVANALVSYLTYIRKTIWPSELGIYYPFPDHVPWEQALAAACILAAVTYLACRRWRTQPYLTVGWFWYLGTLVPVLGLSQHGLWPAWADRFAYIPGVGLFIMFAWGLGEVARRLHRTRWLPAAAAAVVLVALAAAARSQVDHWRNSVSIFTHTIAVTRDNGKAHLHLAKALQEDGRKVPAVHHFRQALRIDRRDAEAHDGLGTTLMSLGESAEAERHFRLALKIDPDLSRAYNNLGILLAGQGRRDEAEAVLQHVLQITPEYAGAYFNLGRIRANRGDVRGAVEMYENALRFRPQMAAALFRLAWIRASHGRPEFRNGAQAVRLAERLCRQTEYRQPESLDLLAAAYAESGRFLEAAATARRASALAADTGRMEMAAEIEQRRKGYEDRRAYRRWENRGPES